MSPTYIHPSRKRSFVLLAGFTRISHLAVLVLVEEPDLLPGTGCFETSGGRRRFFEPEAHTAAYHLLKTAVLCDYCQTHFAQSPIAHFFHRSNWASD